MADNHMISVLKLVLCCRTSYSDGPTRPEMRLTKSEDTQDWAAQHHRSQQCGASLLSELRGTNIKEENSYRLERLTRSPQGAPERSYVGFGRDEHKFELNDFTCRTVLAYRK